MRQDERRPDRIYHYQLREDGSEIFTPFNEFLEEIRDRTGLGWKDLGEMCGVDGIERYANDNDPEYSNPTPDVLSKIAETFGYSLTNFAERYDARKPFLSPFERTEPHAPERGTPEYIRILIRTGEMLHALNAVRERQGIRPQKLSSSFLQWYTGSGFYNKYASTFEDRQRLYEDLLECGKSENIDFSDIELQNFRRNRGLVVPLRKLPDGTTEEGIIEDAILEYAQNATGEKLPVGIYDHVHKRLNLALQQHGLPGRSIYSIRHYIGKIWHGRKEGFLKFVSGSPRTPEDIDVRGTIIRHLETICEPPETKDIFDRTDMERERQNYFERSIEGHQMLLAYLMMPENYRVYLGGDVQLIRADFDDDNHPDNLPQNFDELVHSIKDDDEVAEFVNNWMKCDLVFKTGSGFAVIEVKQNAINTDRFPNGDKACQQLEAYTSVLLGNIKRSNIRNREKEGHMPLKESVKGFVAAYRMDEDTRYYLETEPDKGAIIIPRKTVYDFFRSNNSAKMEIAS